jgi:cell division septum initiation protein DivIVA
MAHEATGSPKRPDERTHAVEEALADILQPELFQCNPFRVLGLPVTAATRAIATQVQKLSAACECGGGADAALDGPFPIRPPPRTNDIKAALRQLHDPLRRLIYELFWFWPLDGGDGASDPGFLALKADDTATAIQLWNAAASHPTTGPIAQHNKAVWSLMTALDLERRAQRVLTDSDGVARYERHWKGAISLWDQIIGHDRTWSTLSARALALDDGRLSLDLVQAIRRSIPQAFVDIDASLVGKYTSDGRADIAALHISLVTQANLHTIDVSDYARTVVARLKAGLLAHAQALDLGIDGREASGVDIAKKLIAPLHGYFTCFTRLDPHAHDDSWEGVIDHVVRRANDYAVVYAHKTDDLASAVALLRCAAELAMADDLRELLDRNINGGIAQPVHSHSEPYLAGASNVQRSQDTPANRVGDHKDNLKEVTTHVRPIRRTKLKKWAWAAAMFIGFVVVIGWLSENTVHRTRATTPSQREAPPIASAAKSTHSTSPGTTATTNFGVHSVPLGPPPSRAGLLSVPPSSPLSVAGPHSIPVSSTPPAPRSTVTYSGPQGLDAEIRSAAQDADRAKAAAAALVAQLADAKRVLDDKRSAVERLQSTVDALEHNIESERLVVSRTDQLEVSQFNQRVQRYNDLVEELRRLNADANAWVDKYNDLAGRAEAQSNEANRLVDAYNEQLERSGTRH